MSERLSIEELNAGGGAIDPLLVIEARSAYRWLRSRWTEVGTR